MVVAAGRDVRLHSFAGEEVETLYTSAEWLLGHAEQLLAEAEHLFDQERLRGTNDTGEQMRESFQVVGAKLRRAREVLRERPGTASVLTAELCQLTGNRPAAACS